MVMGWLKNAFAAPVKCGPVCQAVQNEVDSIGRAEALARLAKKHRIRQRGERRT